MYTLYAHIAPNNKKYFGITSQAPENRWGIDGRGYKTQQLFWRVIQKYGWDNIQHIILAENLSKEWACKLEQDLIWKYQSNNPKYGYNIYEGGDTGAAGKHFTVSAETRQKISRARMGHPTSNETRQKIGRANSIALKGKPSPNIGRKASEATRKLQSESAKKRHEKFVHPMLGKHHTDSAKERIRAANVGKHFEHTQETKDKISLVNKGRKLSDEHKEKIRQAHIGKIVSEETKLKMSESHKKFYSSDDGRELARQRAKRGWETRRRRMSQ